MSVIRLCRFFQSKYQVYGKAQYEGCRLNNERGEYLWKMVFYLVIYEFYYN
jgi:hypothetical protein